MVRPHDGDFMDDEPTTNVRTRRYDMASKHHLITLDETDEYVSAAIMNLDTGGLLTIQLNRSDFDSRDEMVGELFAGSLPNIRDCYDSDAWVTTPPVQKPTGSRGSRRYTIVLKPADMLVVHRNPSVIVYADRSVAFDPPRLGPSLRDQAANTLRTAREYGYVIECENI